MKAVNIEKNGLNGLRKIVGWLISSTAAEKAAKMKRGVSAFGINSEKGTINSAAVPKVYLTASRLIFTIISYLKTEDR